MVNWLILRKFIMNTTGISTRLCIKIHIICLVGQQINLKYLSKFRKMNINGTKELIRISTMTSMMEEYIQTKITMKISSQKNNQSICGKLMVEDKKTSIMIDKINRPLSVVAAVEEDNNSKMTYNIIILHNNFKALKVVEIEEVIGKTKVNFKVLEAVEIE